MSSSTSPNALNPPDLNQTMAGLGFKSVNLFSLLNHVTSAFGTVIQTVFAWVYFLAEVAILVGALVWLIGATFHHAQMKRTGAHIVLYSIVGFAAAVILPGVVVAMDKSFHA